MNKAFAVVTLFVAFSSFAADYTWVYRADVGTSPLNAASWSDPANWDENGVPDSTDAKAVVDLGAATNRYIRLADAVTVYQIKGCAKGHPVLFGENTLTITGTAKENGARQTSDLAFFVPLKLTETVRNAWERSDERGNFREIVDFEMVMLHPLGEVHPNGPLRVHRRLRELVAVRRLHIFKPHVRERQPPLAQSERRKKPLEEPLGLVLVLCPRRTRIVLAVDAHAHRPPAALLLLQVAHSFFSRHHLLLSLVVEKSKLYDKREVYLTGIWRWTRSTREPRSSVGSVQSFTWLRSMRRMPCGSEKPSGGVLTNRHHAQASCPGFGSTR